MAVHIKLEPNTDTESPSQPSSSEPPKMKAAMGQNAPMSIMGTNYEEEKERSSGTCFGYDVRQTVIQNVETISKELVGIICCSF